MRKKHFIRGREVLIALLMLVIFIGAYAGISGLGNVQDEEQTQFVRDAVRKAALTCYSVEGAYPTDLSYLREQYGLAYDENRYAVTYDAFASNQLPDIFVVEREGDE
ncbi:MAG: hypothetical protein IJ246_00560 [Clostridia bacterium]|nr:hypothetical protein [Clostridia bacterium]